VVAHITSDFFDNQNLMFVEKDDSKNNTFNADIVYEISGLYGSKYYPRRKIADKQLKYNVKGTKILGTTHSASSLPPCMALCYIMKL
jgi:hypothetical protein